MKYIIVIAIFVIMSIIGFSLMWIDKKRAENKKWRIKEATLFTVAFLGGGIGATLGMYVFRHKTKHKTFLIGFPILTVLSIVIATLALIYI